MLKKLVKWTLLTVFMIACPCLLLAFLVTGADAFLFGSAAMFFGAFLATEAVSGNL